MRRTNHAALRLVVDNSSDADSGTPRVAQALSNRRCQDPATRRRSRHLRICSELAPSANAADAIAGQRSSENMSIATSMDRLSTDARTTFPLPDFFRARPCGMVAVDEKSYRAALSKRMRDLRDARGLSQAEMAAALGIERDAYIKQEQRGALKPYLQERFAAITGCSVAYLVTGRHETPRVGKPVKRRRKAS